MKINILVILLMLLVGCNENVPTTDGNNKDSLSITSKKDSIKTEIKDLALPNDYYLFIDSIQYGDSYTDDKRNDMIYRLVFSTCEETKSLHAEKIQIVFDGVLKLKKIIKIPNDISGIENDYFNEFIKWESPDEIVIKVYSSDSKLEKIVKVNLLNQSSVEIK
ncbi:MAG: hypothetical protein VB066_06005 [Paludibacter sp.]|nr:hypothetical protein [Paludibacter sp.]